MADIQYVPGGAYLLCDKGSKPGQLTAREKGVSLKGKPWATEFDALPVLNVPDFATCLILKKCVPATMQWQQTLAGAVTVDGEKPLLEHSVLPCTVGGTIRIFMSLSAATAAATQAATNHKMAEEAKQEAREAKENANLLFWAGVGVAAVVGVAAIALTGGAAAPLVALAAEVALEAAVVGAVAGGAAGAVAGGIEGYNRDGLDGAAEGIVPGAAMGALMGSVGGVVSALGGGIFLLPSLFEFGHGVYADVKVMHYEPSVGNGLVVFSDIATIAAGALAAKGADLTKPAPGRYLYREDSFPYSQEGKLPGRLKSYVDEEGNLNPANANGAATVQDHVRGSEPRKSDSPYTSTSAELEAGKSYGDHEIRVDKRQLERDIQKGKVKDVEILEHDKVVGELEAKRVEAQERYDRSPTARNLGKVRDAERDLFNAKRDKEILVKGKVPAKYVRVRKKP
ncbi:DUF4280 domain-containing protein [Hymenobacter weizhouensis]|uniref:DUF4280 domain-containing protein n=1 Tax=Hymenobacter sp. YIM 151500-1 TaxID=2987689 RepID=UPI002225E5C4|nr:DUF4280 domain-containing protein [Hymenobacter sp. YIM 151500-1]UYZ64888.1 DUF4280 domain-containing protein [Hymenobacter sp. YIM 151500-1]